MVKKVESPFPYGVIDVIILRSDSERALVFPEVFLQVALRVLNGKE